MDQESVQLEVQTAVWHSSWSSYQSVSKPAWVQIAIQLFTLLANYSATNRPAGVSVCQSISCTANQSFSLSAYKQSRQLASNPHYTKWSIVIVLSQHVRTHIFAEFLSDLCVPYIAHTVLVVFRQTKKSFLNLKLELYIPEFSISTKTRPFVRIPELPCQESFKWLYIQYNPL